MNTTPATERTHSFCAVPLPHLVYAGPQSKKEFDLIALPETVHDWNVDKVRSVLKGDGRCWETRCHSKALGDFSKGTVSVIFQWFDERPVESVGASVAASAEAAT